MDVATKFPNFENEGNSCWLDSCMILISHNETLRKHVNNCKNSQIRKIVNDYHQALGILNTVPQKRNALKNSRSILTSLQKATLKYLKEFLKFAKGQFESAMCALLSLIMHDKADIKEHFETSLIWHKQCSNCNSYSTPVIKKTIVTLAKVMNFNPTAPTTCYTCMCKKEQEMKGEIKETSDCLIFHFENGAGNGDTLPSQFFISSRKYHLTCIIIFQDSKGVGKDHFITWVRQPFVEQWLEFNDMEDSVVYFSEVKPKLKMENIYIAVYEAFDNLGKTKIGTFSNEDISASNKFVETIHLVDDSAPSPGEENILSTLIDESPCNSTSNSSSHPENEQFNSFKTSDDEHCQSVSPDVTSSETDKDSYFGDNLHAEPKEENKFLLDDPSTRKVLDDVIDKTFAAFFEQIMLRNEKTEAAVDSKSSSGNEENIKTSDDVTSSQTDKDSCFGDNLHAETKEENKFWLDDPSKRKEVDDVIEKTFAAFFEQIMLCNEKTEAAVDSKSSSGNEENIKTSDDVTSTQTDKDSCFGDNLHAEPKEENKFWLDDPSKRKDVDDVIEKTFAAFFEQIVLPNEKREAAVDSESSSGNEENMVATYKCLDQTLFRAERNESPCSSNTDSSSHPEIEQFGSTNSASSDSTETNSKNLSDDSHVERGKKRRKF